MKNKDICNDKNQLKKEIKNSLTSELYAHNLRTAQKAQELADNLALNSDKAFIAGLLHDICKGMKEKEMKKILLNSTWSADRWEKQIPELMHAPASAARAEREFGLNDMEILEAIRFHSTGFAGMEKFTSVIFLADKIEPGRDYPGLKKIREHINRDNFSRALLTVCNNTINFLLDNNSLIHPNTLLLRNFLLRRKQGNDR